MSISITCPGCDRGLKAPDTSAGRRIKCPKCGTAISVPSEDEEPRKMAATAKPSRRDREDEEEERRPRKKKRKQKNNTGLYVGLGIGAAALIGVIILVIILLNSQTPTGSQKNKEVVQQDKNKPKEQEVVQPQEQGGDDDLPPLEGNGLQTERTQSLNRLKQLALAMHSYHDERKKFPGAAMYHRDDLKKSKPLLSWRVALLPYLEQDPLYKLFKLDEPWDSENNKTLLDKMPEVYKPVRRSPPSGTKTYYQVLTGKRGPFGEGRELRLNSFTDGTSNTFLIVEGERPVVWTKPEDIEYDFVPKGDFMKEPPANFKFKNGHPVNKLGGMFANGFNAVMADGASYFFLREIPAYKIHAMITYNGGESITLQDQ